VEILANKMFKEASWFGASLRAGVYTFLMYLVMLPLAACGYFMFVYADLALALMLGIGPLFVGLALFAPTRRFFDSWLAQVVNFLMFKLLSSATLSFMLATFEAFFTSSGAGDLSMQAVAMVVAGLFCFGMLGMIPAMAASLAGGGAWMSASAANTMRSVHQSTVGSVQSALASKDGVGIRAARSQADGGFFRPVSQAKGRTGAGPGNTEAVVHKQEGTK
jgi:type IV secretion system protein VirB6